MVEQQTIAFVNPPAAPPPKKTLVTYYSFSSNQYVEAGSRIVDFDKPQSFPMESGGGVGQPIV